MIIPPLAVYLPTPEEKTKLAAMTPLVGESWDKVKHLNWGKVYYSDMVKFLTKVQQDKCCYCGSQLWEAGDGHIDHIIPKSKTPQFSFEPQNLALACSHCNGPKNKHNWYTIAKKSHTYRDIKFKIVHPYLDNPYEHYRLLPGHESIVIQSITRKGLVTIKRLGLDTVSRTTGRYFQLDRKRNTLSGHYKDLYEAAVNFRRI